MRVTTPPLVTKMWTNMLIGTLLIGTVLSSPTDEVGGFLNKGELTLNDETYVMHMMPSGYSAQKLQKQPKLWLSDVVGKDNKHYRLFKRYVDKGYAMKGLTFNIYDDKMIETALTLFELLRDVEEKDFPKVQEWAKQHINDDMFEYVTRLASLYYNKFGDKETNPPFIAKPNYYVNGETIRKALKIKMNNGYFNGDDAQVNQYYRTDDIITINTNYSAWNYPQTGVETLTRYFTEDISLNSYYYGIHLLHPFWIKNEKLDEFNPRHAEHFYFTHRQLLTRYILEKEHIKEKNKGDYFFNTYLVYENGLPFAVRSDNKGDETEYRNRMKAIDIAIKECISRGLVFMDNGSTITITEDNYVDLITKLIRTNYDGVKTAKIVRSLYGYGFNGHPTDIYNPAPSLLHHPETSLRDPAIWFMIEYMLKYFSEYTKSLEPYDISNVETEEYFILDSNFTKITTYFDYYQFNISQAINQDSFDNKQSSLTFTARQKRLNHLPFTLNFTIQSTNESEAIVRLFLGPQCNYKDCWGEFSKFYLLDAFSVLLKEGVQTVSWSPENSQSLSFDDFFNLENNNEKENMYNVFKFPNNLLIPQGLEEGLNFTLFILVTPPDDCPEIDFSGNLYRNYTYTLDAKPLDFPFHRLSSNYSHTASNYKFYNFTIFHEKRPIDDSGYFSLYLY